MNIERIKSVLARTEGVTAWFLQRQESDAVTVIRLPGLYSVVQGRLERRANPSPREVIHAPSEETRATVYSKFERDGRAVMGEATNTVLSDDEPAVRQVAAGLVTACRSQSNRPWSVFADSPSYPEVELADPAITAATRSGLIAMVQDFSDAVLKAARSEPAIEVSNLEVFVHSYRNSLATSAGAAAAFPSTRINAEVCFIARFGDKAAEHTCRPYVRRFADLDPAALVRTNAAIARGIGKAGPPPACTGAVVLTGEAVHDFFNFNNSPLGFHCSARAVHDKMSRYEKDKPVAGDREVTGDRLTVLSDPLLQYGLSSNRHSAFDSSPARKVNLVRDGRFCDLVGSRRYFDYLGLLDQGTPPSGPFGNAVVPAGASAADRLIGTDRVVVVHAFSDFRADPASGDFASEIRLGEVREGGKAAPFKGGLLIGNWFDAMADVRFSQETTVMDDYHGPAVVRFGSLQVAG
jgi:predicted Zn-dependent protease